MNERKIDSKKDIYKVKTYPVPFSLKEINQIIFEDKYDLLKPSKEQIISNALNLHLQGNIPEAAKCYQLFIDQGYLDPEVFSNYGVLLIGINKIEKAIKLFKKSIKLFPDNPLSFSNLGNIYRDIGNLNKAEFYMRKAIKINPNYLEANLNLGSILKDLNKLNEAEFYTRKAIDLNPQSLDAYNNLGTILIELGKIDEAKKVINKVFEMDSNNLLANCNMGIVLRELGKLNDAEISIRKSIELKPDYFNSHFNLSLLKLLKGDYKSGLELYESRFVKDDPVVLSCYPKVERFNFINNTEDQNLLVVSEQGLGDTIQYMRYIKILRDKGIDVSFCAQTKLHSLIKESGIDSNPLSPEEAKKVSVGKWIPLLSLMKYLEIDPQNPLINEPYIYTTKKLNNKWKHILSKEKKPVIGINWQGNPLVEKGTQKGRSIPLENFSTLVKNKNINLLSLQKGFGSEQLETCSFREVFCNCQKQVDLVWDFLEIAAIINNCDLVITSDTAVAHLAGGLGKPTWLLLRDLPEWRWGLEGNKTFWYPSMRLFRQKQKHNWNEVMHEILFELSILINSIILE